MVKIKFTVLASGSKANCYILQNDEEVIIIEAGIPFLEVKKFLDFDVSKIKCVVLSHCHFDHSKYINEYAKAGIPIITSAGTIEKLNLSVPEHRSGYWYQFGGFNITPFRVEHDCDEPFGFLIRHDEIGTMLFATDTQYIRYDFSNLRLNHLMIECNYDTDKIDEMVLNGHLHESLRNRIVKSHMSLETCKKFIEHNMSSALLNVCLLHLSDGNSLEKLILKEVKETVDNTVCVTIADSGLEINVDLFPW